MKGKVKLSIFGMELGIFEMHYRIVASGGEVEPVSFLCIDSDEQYFPSNFPKDLRKILTRLSSGDTMYLSAFGEFRNQVRWKWA